jgi:hypothetical protein
MMIRLIAACALAAGLAAPVTAQTTGTTNMDILRQKGRRQEAGGRAELQLTDAEGTVLGLYEAPEGSAGHQSAYVERILVYAAYNKPSPTTWRKSCSTSKAWSRPR